MKKKVSVIIPHYNSPCLLDKLLSTITDREEIEVIVVDDNSDRDRDQLEKCMEKYGDRIIWLQNEGQEHSGGICRNIGLNAATGEWLLFADADDYFLDDFYSKIEKYFDSDYDIVHFSPTSVWLDSGKIANRHELSEKLVMGYLRINNHENELKLRFGFETPWSKLIRTNMVKNNNIWFDGTKAANDVMFSTRAALAAGKVQADSNIIYCITKYDGSVSSRNNYEIYCIRLKVFIDKYQYLKKRLSKKDWKILNLNAAYLVRRILKSNHSINKKVCVIILLIKNKVALFDHYKYSFGHIINKLKEH